MSDTDRPYDVVVWGATGVAGGLVAEYLTERHSSEELYVALDGRDKGRLDSLAAELYHRGVAEAAPPGRHVALEVLPDRLAVGVGQH